MNSLPFGELPPFQPRRFLPTAKLNVDDWSQVAPFFDHWDLLLTPVIASQPTRIGEIQSNPEKAFRLLEAVQFTGQFSQTGQPAIAVPHSLDVDGLPVGVQLVGRPADEATLIRVAAQLEQANPWIARRPAAA